jgi:hypothetical protein
VLTSSSSEEAAAAARFLFLAEAAADLGVVGGGGEPPGAPAAAWSGSAFSLLKGSSGGTGARSMMFVFLPAQRVSCAFLATERPGRQHLRKRRGERDSLVLSNER